MQSDNEHGPGRPEQPRSEPEIIPPGRNGRRGDRTVWVSVDDHGGTQRIYVAQPSPFSLIAALIIAGLVLAGIVLLLLGLVLFWVPIIILIVAAILAAGYIRYYWRRLRFWATGR